MRGLNLGNVGEFPKADFGSEDASGIHRRQFLKELGIVTAGLTLTPQIVLAQTNDEAQEWYDLVNNFIFTVASGSQARAMASQLRQMTMYWVSRTGVPFHWTYAASFVFKGATIPSQHVICENGFQLVQLPYYDTGCPCNDYTDLNVAEIKTVIHPDEMNRFGCVLAPAGERVSINNDHARYVDRAAAHYPEINLNDWYVPAERQMVGKGRTHTGFHLVHRTKRTPSGRPKTEFIVSGDI